MTHAISQNAANPNNFDSIPEGMEIVKKFRTGEELPFNVKITGEVFNFNTTDQVMKIAQTIFVKVNPEGPAFKLKDEDNWKNFEEFFTGRLDAGLGAHDESSLQGNISLDMNIRA